MSRRFRRDNVVCVKCVEDAALADVVRENGVDAPCDFCGGEQETGAFEAVLARVRQAIDLEWSHPEDELLLDSESETGWAGEVFDGWEVLAEIGYEPKAYSLHEAIALALSDSQFCQRNYGLMREKERWLAGWKEFKHAVKHERRFTFWSMGDRWNEPYHPDFLAVGEVLREIGELVRQANLVRILEPGHAFWRVRVHDVWENCTQDSELSAPPTEKATRSNRMSPAGISMFYGAEDLGTACDETIDRGGDASKAVTWGRFVAQRQMRLLDLTDLPESPSYFEIQIQDRRRAIEFLHRFVKDMAERISLDGREHIEYVPTQVFTEFVRFQLKANATEGFDGMRYRSSRTGRACVVLFCGQSECLDVKGEHRTVRWLALDRASVGTANIGDLWENTP